MARLNHHFSKLDDTPLFWEINRRIASHREADSSAIDLASGDVTHPLPPAVLAALLEASSELGSPSTRKGYGPTEGYRFLREAIASHEYRGLSISPDAIFISDGALSALGHLQEIFAIENRVALPDIAHPAHVEIHVMAGRTRPQLKGGGYGGVVYIPMTEETNFIPLPPNRPADLIYLCSPNNPTGTAMSRPVLESWIRYAKEHGAILIFDGTYEAYVRSPNTPRSIYEIEGAKEVAIEIRSFSKNAAFTGLRCSYAVVPFELTLTESYRTQSVHELWKRRQLTKFGGVPYPVQKAAAAIYTPQGQQEVKALVDAHLKQAKLLKEGLVRLGHTVYGGIDAPYLWMKTPDKLTSTLYFDHLLKTANLFVMPGSAFGPGGEGYMRLSAFADPSHISDALHRMAKQ